MARRKNALGLDIGSSSVKLVQFRESKKGIELANFSMAPLPSEAIVDGALMNSPAVVDTIQSMVSAQKLKSREVAVSVSGHSVIIKKISLPAMTPEELADLIIASSATPPFTPMGRFRGRTLLDGGLVDNAPASAAEAVREVRRNLVLLTRPYPPSCLGQKGSRLYVAPTREVPVDVWDYTRPELLDRTIEMGEREASVHDRALRRFLVR